MVQVFAKEIKKIVRKHTDIFPHGMSDVRILMDNATWHKKAKDAGLAEAMGLTDEQFIQQPPSSPDFNSPVERAHSILLRRVNELLAMDSSVDELEAVKKLLQDTWSKGGLKGRPLISPVTAMALFDHLEVVYEEVIKAKGGYGSKTN